MARLHVNREPASPLAPPGGALGAGLRRPAVAPHCTFPAPRRLASGRSSQSGSAPHSLFPECGCSVYETAELPWMQAGRAYTGFASCVKPQILDQNACSFLLGDLNVLGPTANARSSSVLMCLNLFEILFEPGCSAVVQKWRSRLNLLNRCPAHFQSCTLLCFRGRNFSSKQKRHQTAILLNQGGHENCYSRSINTTALISVPIPFAIFCAASTLSA